MSTMYHSGDKDVNKADKMYCSHRGYILEGKRQSIKKIACSMSYDDTNYKN